MTHSPFKSVWHGRARCFSGHYIFVWMYGRAWQLADGLCSKPVPPVLVWHHGLRDVIDGFLPISIKVRRAAAPFCSYEMCKTTSVAISQARYCAPSITLGLKKKNRGCSWSSKNIQTQIPNIKDAFVHTVQAFYRLSPLISSLHFLHHVLAMLSLLPVDIKTLNQPRNKCLMKCSRCASTWGNLLKGAICDIQRHDIQCRKRPHRALCMCSFPAFRLLARPSMESC